MAMNVGSADEEEGLNSTINTTPLVDVMLVLLIIFLITIPVVTTSVKLELPKETNSIRESKPENIVISVDRQGRIFYYDTPMPNAQAIFERLRKVSTMNPQPEVHIRGDMASNYEPVGRVLYAVQRAGIAKVAFLTEPTGPGGN